MDGRGHEGGASRHGMQFPLVMEREQCVVGFVDVCEELRADT